MLVSIHLNFHKQYAFAKAIQAKMEIVVGAMYIEMFLHVRCFFLLLILEFKFVRTFERIFSANLP